MRVLMQISMAGRDFAVTTGEVYECDEATARRLIAAGYASPLPVSPPVPETTMRAPAPERAMKPRGRPRG